jgi:hypothetical protein
MTDQGQHWSPRPLPRGGRIRLHSKPISIPAVLETINYWLVRQLVLG